MFQITENPSSGSLVQCLAENYKIDSIVYIDMDKVGVMAAYCDLLCVRVLHSIDRHCVCTAQYRQALCVYCTV